MKMFQREEKCENKMCGNELRKTGGGNEPGEMWGFLRSVFFVIYLPKKPPKRIFSCTPFGKKVENCAFFLKKVWK